MSLVQDCMETNFSVLKEDVTPRAAAAELADRPYCVVENAGGQGLGAVTRSDIESAIAAAKPSLGSIILEGGPLLKVHGGLEMQVVSNSPNLKTLIRETKVALVIDDSRKTVGLLTGDAVKHFISSGQSRQRTAVLSSDQSPCVEAGELPGAICGLTLYKVCRECGYGNEIDKDQWDAIKRRTKGSELTCQNPDPMIAQHWIK